MCGGHQVTAHRERAKLGASTEYWAARAARVGAENRNMNANQIVNGAGTEVWDRLPNKGYYLGMSRPYIYQLINRGDVKTALIKSPGCVRGIRLVWRPSVLAFIEKNVVKVG